MATPEQILAVICPRLFDTADYQVYIDLAVSQTAQEHFGLQYDLAVALRAAHMWTINTKRNGQSGVVTYRMEGRLAESYGGIGVIRNELELTNYGLQLLQLMNTVKAPISTTNAYMMENEGVI